MTVPESLGNRIPRSGIIQTDPPDAGMVLGEKSGRKFMANDAENFLRIQLEF